jgi:hypothetical protein
MPTYPLGFHLNPLTNPWVEKLTQTHTLIEQKPTGFRVAGTHCHLYSLVVISQINKEWDCSSDSMGKYCTAVRKLEDKFEGLEFHHIERDRNTAADVLSKLGSGRTQVPPGVFVQEILQLSISMDQTEECNIINQLESDSDD